MSYEKFLSILTNSWIFSLEMKSPLPICCRSVFMARVQTTRVTHLEEKYRLRFTILITQQPISWEYCFAGVCDIAEKWQLELFENVITPSYTTNIHLVLVGRLWHFLQEQQFRMKWFPNYAICRYLRNTFTLLSTRPSKQELSAEPFICCSRSGYGEKRNLEDKVGFPRSPDVVSAVPPITRQELDLSHRPSRMETLKRTWSGGGENKLAYRYYRTTLKIIDRTFVVLWEKELP